MVAHVSGTRDEADALLRAHPDLATLDLFTAAVLGEERAVREHLARDPASATATSAPHGWTALVYLCFSRYLRLDPARSDGFVAAARALLEAGADPNAGWNEADEYATWEPALYGAAGLAHHAGVTELLLEHGADPDDNETCYHSPESHDNAVVRLLLETGRISPVNRLMMLIRKLDVHDLEGVRLLLKAGADANGLWDARLHTLQHSITRGNAIEIVEALLAHGADPAFEVHGHTAVLLAALEGRADVLARFAPDPRAATLLARNALLVACANGDAAAAMAAAQADPAAANLVRAHGGEVIARFAGNGNAAGIDCLLGLGIAVDARRFTGDGYFDIAPNSTALHVAAWRARHEVVRQLIVRGADVSATDGAGRTPLALAVRACVDSHWTDRRAPDSVAALLAAGAAKHGLRVPTGDDSIDALLA